MRRIKGDERSEGEPVCLFYYPSDQIKTIAKCDRSQFYKVYSQSTACSLAQPCWIDCFRKLHFDESTSSIRSELFLFVCLLVCLFLLVNKLNRQILFIFI